MEREKWTIYKRREKEYEIWCRRPNDHDTLIARDMKEKDARLILKCCNSHGGLVEALQRALTELEYCTCNHGDMRDKAVVSRRIREVEQALAAAKD